MKDKKQAKICGICGDKAHGYNFNAITCESCKAFFRRNALINKEFRCRADGKCHINQVTRKYCKKCRLDKCFKLGMRKEYILSEEQKQKLKNKIVNNRKKRVNEPKVTESVITYHNSGTDDDKEHQNSKSNNCQTFSSSESETSDRGQDGINTAQDIDNVVQEVRGVQRVQEVDTNASYNNQLMNISSEVKNPTELLTNYFDLGVSSPALNTYTQNSDNYNSFYEFLQTNPYFSETNDCFEAYSTDNTEFKQKCLPLETINYSDISQSSDGQSVIQSSYVDQCSDIGLKSYNNNFDEKIIENNSIDIEKSDTISDNVYQTAIELEFAAIPIKEYSETFSNVELNKYEIDRIQELNLFTVNLNIRDTKKDNFNITSELTKVLDLAKLCAKKVNEMIRKLVNDSKQIRGFNGLCLDDQIALMKGGCFEIMMVKSTVNYNFEKDCWTIPRDQNNNAALVKLDIFKVNNMDFYKAYIKFINSFKSAWDTDRTILDLLVAIILFNPNRQNTLHKELIKLEQQTYMHLLQRYLFLKLNSECEAKQQFLKLMSKLEELHYVGQSFTKIFFDIQPGDVGPLLMEILDINPYNTL